MDGRFVAFMLVRLSSSTGRNGHPLQVDILGTYRISRDCRRVQESCLPVNSFAARTVRHVGILDRLVR